MILILKNLFIFIAISIPSQLVAASASKNSKESAGTLDYDEELSWTFGIKTGFSTFATNFTKGVESTANLEIISGESTANVAGEFLWFKSKNLAADLGYRIVIGAHSRATYQASYGGLTYYPTTLGIPIIARRSYNTIRYSFSYKPFLNAGVSIGRQIIATTFNGTSDISSEFFGGNVGGGVQWMLGDRYGVDICGIYERAIGFNPKLKWGSNNVFALLGAHVYY